MNRASVMLPHAEFGRGRRVFAIEMILCPCPILCPHNTPRPGVSQLRKGLISILSRRLNFSQDLLAWSHVILLVDSSLAFPRAMSTIPKAHYPYPVHNSRFTQPVQQGIRYGELKRYNKHINHIRTIKRLVCPRGRTGGYTSSAQSQLSWTTN